MGKADILFWLFVISLTGGVIWFFWPRGKELQRDGEEYWGSPLQPQGMPVTRFDVGLKPTVASRTASRPHTKTPPKRVKAKKSEETSGKNPSEDSRRNDGSQDDGFLTSMAVAAGTDNAIVGALVGGNLLGGIVGAALVNTDDDSHKAQTTTDYSPPDHSSSHDSSSSSWSDSSDSSSSSGGDSGGGGSSD